MKITKRQLRRIIREEKQKLQETSGGSQHFEDLKDMVEQLIQDHMMKSGLNRKMAIYEIELALSNQKRGANIRRTR
tara:strand:+ start:7418 stop:7645 length:228 start_codon:yes stop_codon:yes gene_type:complete